MHLVPGPSRLRRRLLKAGVALPFAVWSPRGLAEASPTPECGDGPTTGMTAGPFYSEGSPEKRDLLADDPGGQPVELRTLVLDTRCRPLKSAVVDLWHTDRKGRYDNNGFRMRGRQRTDGLGAARFQTLRPGRYGWRTPHYHVRIFGEDGSRLLTTQLYFPGEAANRKDGLFRGDLLMDVTPVGALLRANFTFIVQTT